MELQDFISRIPNFEKLSPAAKIPYFAYFILEIQKKESFTGTDIKECFKHLKLLQYSNISAYLSGQVKKTLIKEKRGYVLERGVSDRISQDIGEKRLIAPSDNLFPLTLLNDSRAYLVNVAKQATQCYDCGLYDASSVMIRKLVETLIIELFERHKISDNIKDQRTGFFYYLFDLINCLLDEYKKGTWNIGRNAIQALPFLKSAGDQSAHNRRYNATKQDIDKLIPGLRIVVEELVHLIDYPAWNKEKQ